MNGRTTCDSCVATVSRRPDHDTKGIVFGTLPCRLLFLLLLSRSSRRGPGRSQVLVVEVPAQRTKDDHGRVGSSISGGKKRMRGLRWGKGRTAADRRELL